MICLCGYANKNQNSWTHTEEAYIGKRIGEEEFIEIHGSYLTKESYYPPREVSLYACPECNTVQLVD